MNPTRNRESHVEASTCPDQRLADLAFQYVLGELSADDEAAFTAELLESQAAREAVAAAVELREAIKFVEQSEAGVAAREREVATPVAISSPNPSSNSGWWKPVVWMSAGAAVCLLVVFGSTAGVSLGLFGPEHSSAPTMVADTSRTNADSQRQLALTWSRTWQMREEVDTSAGTAEIEEIAADDSDTNDANGSLVPAAPRGMPSWVLAAVSEEEDEIVPDAPSATESRKEL